MYCVVMCLIFDGWTVEWLWVQTISPSFYAYNALLLDEFTPINELYITTVIGDNHETAGPFTGRDILNCFGFAKETYSYYMIWLVIILGIMIGVTYLALEFLVKERR